MFFKRQLTRVRLMLGWQKMSFSALKLSAPILKALADLHYSQATAIQKQAVPVILAGKNLIAAVQTGTGKTANFVSITKTPTF